MKRLLTIGLMAVGLSMLAACSKGPDDLLKDGQAAMEAISADATLDTALVKKGLASVQEFLNRYPDDPRADSAMFMMASLQEILGKHREAAENFLQLLRTYPNSAFRPKSLILAGSIFESLRDYPRARACYERLIREFPDHEFVTGGSAQWLLDHMGEPPEQWPIPFTEDTLSTPRRGGAEQPPS